MARRIDRVTQLAFDFGDAGRFTKRCRAGPRTSRERDIVVALPEAARDYVQFLGRKLGVPISIVSVGPERGQTIMID